jgi:hypothetical protein
MAWSESLEGSAQAASTAADDAWAPTSILRRLLGATVQRGMCP